jgi:hypothetical protein
MLDNSRRYELIVRPLGRSPADEYYHNGTTWIEGRDGNRYVVEIANNSTSNIEVVVSVDGLDVLEGKAAGPDSRGYVISALSRISIPGWKLNNAEAAEFFFSRGTDSYVSSIGGAVSNTGVIGAMVFHERPVYQYATAYPFIIGGQIYNGYPPPVPDWTSTSLTTTTGMYAPIDSYNIVSGTNNITGTSFGSILRSTGTTSAKTAGVVQTQQSVVTQEVGTGLGDATEWATKEVTFNRNNPTEPDSIMAIYYDSARNLERMGIMLRKKSRTASSANPFPAYSSSSPGCITPPGWKGRS